MSDDFTTLVEQARERSVRFTPNWPNTARLLAGLADAVERLQREWDDLNNARIEEKNRNHETRARVAALEAALQEIVGVAENVAATGERTPAEHQMGTAATRALLDSGERP